MKRLIAVLACFAISLCCQAGNDSAGAFEALFKPSFTGWRAVGGDDVSAVTIDGKKACQFSGDFSNVKDRISWDVSDSFDFSQVSSVALSLQVTNPDSISIITFYFNTSGGRYRFNVPVKNLQSGWNVINIVPGKLETEGKPTGLNTIVAIRISAWKKTDEPVKFYIMPGGVASEEQSPGKVESAENSVSSSADAAGELISNPSLESVKNGRAAGYNYLPIPGGIRGEAKFAITNDAHSGNNALLMTRLNDGGLFGIYPPFKKIDSSDKVRYYRAGVWMKSKAVAPVAVQVQCANSKWTKGYTHYCGDAAAEWTEYFALAKLDPGQDIGHFRICVGFGLTVNGDLMFLDDFSFREITADEYVKLLSLQQAQRNKKWQPIKVPAKDAAGNNMFMNSSFENNLEHWGFSYTMQSRARNEQMKWDDKEKYHGSYSMRYDAWPRWYEAGGRIQSPPINVKKGGTYTFSAYMKSNEPGIKTVLEVREAATSASSVSVSCQLTDKWQRFSVSFKVPQTAKGIAIACIAMPNTWLQGKDFGNRKVWIDAVQIEEGGLSDYNPPPTVEVVGNTSSPNALFVEGEPVKLNARMSIPDSLCRGGAEKWKLVYEFENVFGKIVDVRSFEISPPAQGEKPEIEHSFVWDTKLLGSFCAHLKVKSGDAELANGINVFAVLPELSSDVRKHSGLFGVNTFSSRYLCDFAVKMGVGSIRLHDDNYLRWMMLQPKKGDKLWYEPEKDAILKDTKNAGVHILANMELGSMWASTAPASVKDYMRTKYPPQLEPWRIFVRDQAAHFDNIVDAWEIWNEPYLQDWWKGTPKDYVELLKTSYHEIKKINPQTPVVGICGQLNSNGWNMDCLKLGAIKFMDVFSYHMYVSLNSGGPEESWVKCVAENRENFIKAGKDVPIWNTEAGTEHDSYYKPFYSRKPNVLPRLSAAIVAQSYATALAAGMERLYWYILDEDCGPSGAGGLYMLEYNGTPKPVIPAFTASIKFLSGKKFAQKADLGKGTVCFVFAGKSEPVAVIWRSLGAKPVKTELNGDSVRVFDVMGNELAVENGKISTEFSIFPLYVQGRGSVDELVAAIKR